MGYTMKLNSTNVSALRILTPVFCLLARNQMGYTMKLNSTNVSALRILTPDSCLLSPC